LLLAVMTRIIWWRALAAEIPLVTLSTGTNSVFPEMREATIAGVCWSHRNREVSTAEGTAPNKVLRIDVDGQARGLEMVDVAVSSEW